VGGSGQKHPLSRTNRIEGIMEERIKALEDKYAVLEERIVRLEAFTGSEDFDADGRDSLHRRLDWLEDWKRDSYVES
jgi:hypothetical protein